MRLSGLATIGTNQPESDFWLVRKGSDKEVGRPVREFSPEHIGILVGRKDLLLPDYLFYIFMDLYARGYWVPRACGSLRLRHIRILDVKRLELSIRP